jgi:hypothetical protein
MKKSVCLLFGALVMLAGPTSSFLTAQNRPPLHWVSGGESIVVKQGEAFDFQAQFYSDVAITDARWVIMGRMESLIYSEHSANRGAIPIGNVEPNRIYSIRVHLQVPQNFAPGLYTGDMRVFTPKYLSGSDGWQFFPEFLRVKFYVMDANP